MIMGTTLTTTDLRLWFKEYNNLYFEGKLPSPSFQIKRCTSYLGKCWPTRKLIVMSTFYNRSERDLRQTFIHEMIHLYNYYFDERYVGHGTPFKRKANEINRKGGWNIKRCSYVPQDAKEEIKPKVSKMVYALAVNTHQHYGKLHFSLISKESFEKGQYKHTLEYFKSQNWQVSLFKTSTRHYPSARVCRKRVHGNYLRTTDIENAIMHNKLIPITLVGHQSAI